MATNFKTFQTYSDHDHDHDWPERSRDRQVSVDEPNDFSIDPYAGYTFGGKPVFDLDGVIDQIATGRSIDNANGVITYSFADTPTLTGLYNNPNYGFTAGYGYSPFTEEQRAEARESIELWDDLIAAEFRETNGRGADIQFANSLDPGQAYAYYPVNGRGYQFQSDVFVADPEVNWSNAWLGFGGYGATTLVHELGHSLGLSHPGNYNGAGATTYEGQAEYAQDSEQYTIMSYWGLEETSLNQLNVDWSTGFYNNPQTPLVHDILAVQSIYGADETTRAGDTVYGWNSTAGNEVYDFSLNLFPYLSIYDAGGIDTIDMSGAGVSVYINLNEGSFSSGAAAIPDEDYINARRQDIRDAGYEGLADVREGTSEFWSQTYQGYYEGILRTDTYLATGMSVDGLYTTAVDNLSIAYGTVIENAIGSTERDFLFGNDVDNVLTGLGGDDVLVGNAGDDTLIGGEGADEMTGGEGADLFVIEGDDIITDFASGEDTIDLSGYDFTYVGENAFTGTAGELRVEDGMLMGDIDGDGVADLFVDVQGDPIVMNDLVL